MRTRLLIIGAALIWGGVAESASAYTFMKKPFQKRYDLRLVSCTACHMKGEDKDAVNPFGSELKKLLDGKDVPARVEACKEADPETKARLEKELNDEFVNVLMELDKQKAPCGRPYAELIRSGELEGTKLKKAGSESESASTDEESGDNESAE